MPSTSRRVNQQELESYIRHHSKSSTNPQVELPFQKARPASVSRPARPSHLTLTSVGGQTVNLAPAPRKVAAPQMVPTPVRPTPTRLPTERTDRKIPLLVRVNRLLRTALVAMCGIAIVGYGVDVTVSNDVGRTQEQVRRLNEQNSELSAQLLRSISFQGIQDSVVGRFGLRVPEQVLLVQFMSPPAVPQFHPDKHHLPVMAGY